jgi:hypothetical protein
MKERPILFAGPMVRGVVEERKRQTRRFVKGEAVAMHEKHIDRWLREGDVWRPLPADEDTRRQFVTTWPTAVRCPYGVEGDRLWIRENFRLPAQFNGHRAANVKENVKIHYAADGEPSGDGAPFGILRPAIHLPRVRCRVLVQITSVRIERLGDIANPCAIEEGIAQVAPPDAKDGRQHWGVPGMPTIDRPTPALAFRSLFREVNANRFPWDSWVWVIRFHRVPV